MKYFDPFIPLLSNVLASQGKLRDIMCMLVVATAAITAAAIVYHPKPVGSLSTTTTTTTSKISSIIYSGREFTAEYECVCLADPRRISTVLLSCNGKGLFVYESDRHRVIYDHNKKLEFSLVPFRKLVIVIPKYGNNAHWLDEETFLMGSPGLVGYKQLSDEQLEGRNCRVYDSDINEKRYYDKGTGLLVLQRGGIPSRTYLTRLVKYSTKALPSTNFELPKDYRHSALRDIE